MTSRGSISTQHGGQLAQSLRAGTPFQLIFPSSSGTPGLPSYNWDKTAHGWLREAAGMSGENLRTLPIAYVGTP